MLEFSYRDRKVYVCPTVYVVECINNNMSKTRKKDFLATSASEYFTSAKLCLEKQPFFSLLHHICQMCKTTLCLFCLQEEVNKKKWIVSMQSFKRKKKQVTSFRKLGKTFFYKKDRKMLPPFQELIPRNRRKSQLLLCPRLPQLKAGIRS